MSITDSETIGLDSSTTSLAMLPTCCVGDTLSDRYRLDQEIGRGGMGIVFRSWDIELERPVAVKVMAAHLEGADDRTTTSQPSIQDNGVRAGRPHLLVRLGKKKPLREGGAFGYL